MAKNLQRKENKQRKGKNVTANGTKKRKPATVSSKTDSPPKLFKGPKYPTVLPRDKQRQINRILEYNTKRHNVKKTDPAVKLLSIAQACGVHVVHVEGPVYQAELKYLKLKLNPKVLTRARRMEHDSAEQLKQLVWDMGGTYNGRRSPTMTQEQPTLTASMPLAGRKVRLQKRGTVSVKPAAPSKPIIVKPPKPEGPSNKETVYKLWIKSKRKMTPEQLLKTTKAAVKLITVKSWVGSWLKGKNLPAFAKKGK